MMPHYLLKRELVEEDGKFSSGREDTKKGNIATSMFCEPFMEWISPPKEYT
jgi:hypothetical protein